MKFKPEISTSANGPLLAKSTDTILSNNGLPHQLKNTTVVLCRCGQSKSKSFCDGTHGKIGWEDKKLDGRQPRIVRIQHSCTPKNGYYTYFY